MKSLVVKIFRLLDTRDRRFLFLLLLFSLLISLIEIAGVAVIMPFLSVATDFSHIHETWYFQEVYRFFSFENDVHFVLAFGGVLILFYIFRALINYLYFHLLARFSKGRYYSIAIRLFRGYLAREYREFILSSKAELTKVLVTEGQNMMLALSSLLFMMSELFILLMIYGILLWIDWRVTLAITLFLSLNFLLLVSTVSRGIKEAGTHRELHEKHFYKVLQTVFGNYKMIKLSQTAPRHYERFREAADRLSRAKIRFESLREIPRLYLEASGFIIVISIILYFLYTTQGSVTAYLPTISVFILALYRLLPSVHRLFGSYNNVLYNYRAIEVIHDEILYPVERIGNEPLPFERGIELREVHFAYAPGREVLRGVDLRIRKGEKVGIVGESGSGKSTLIDILIGLFRPSEGSVLVDGRALKAETLGSWRRRIGYIPQRIELMEGSVAYNVALDEHYDPHRVRTVLEQARLYDLFARREGIETPIGEDGIDLSGGQRQRLAIARALYHDPELLVLDEATSALDPETEREIMELFYRLGSRRTLVIVTHRRETLAGCDRLYILSGGILHEGAIPCDAS
jgi:ABC-type multidrug transport system fused ATPase/permease subunit